VELEEALVPPAGREHSLAARAAPTEAPFFSWAWRLGLILFGVALTLAWLSVLNYGLFKLVLIAV
jgi:hypothetical protein